MDTKSFSVHFGLIENNQYVGIAARKNGSEEKNRRKIIYNPQQLFAYEQTAAVDCLHQGDIKLMFHLS